MKHHVLVVDDEADVRAAIRLQLRDTRLDILEAGNFQQAIDLLRDNAISIDVIICDVRMPGTSGVEAVEVFQREFPNTP
jgi:CheY-like chemotaxis protein